MKHKTQPIQKCPECKTIMIPLSRGAYECPHCETMRVSEDALYDYDDDDLPDDDDAA